MLAKHLEACLVDLDSDKLMYPALLTCMEGRFILAANVVDEMSRATPGRSAALLPGDIQKGHLVWR